eukprot:TRINITY_DN1217_c0_g1_i1.p1 TRINITY_DN1217_c0_g1~~TRINITY_DN1217_c0_g1_i1.p1  ORF type:complete len:229 (+),score=64.99 TRINITY_DN1217_c0_g1_i1:29-715(+)
MRVSVVIVVACLVAVASAIPPRHSEEINKSGNVTWDYLMYVARWPGTVARGQSLPAFVNSFTLHGMWPQRYDGSWPSFCTKEPMDRKSLAPIYKQLYADWYDYQGNGYSFWEHEWSKHGTCAISDPIIGNELKFFTTALKLHDQVDVPKVLSAQGIVPSNSKSYEFSKINSAVKSAYGVDAVFGCTSSNLNTMVFCFDKNLKLQQCPSNLKPNGGACRSTVKFPVIQH